VSESYHTAPKKQGVKTLRSLEIRYTFCCLYSGQEHPRLRSKDSPAHYRSVSVSFPFYSVLAPTNSKSPAP